MGNLVAEENATRFTRRKCVGAHVGKELAKEFHELCNEYATTRSKAIANFIRAAVTQKTLTTIVTVGEGEKFNGITKALKLTHSEAIRQLILRVNSGAIRLEGKHGMMVKR